MEHIKKLHGIGPVQANKIFKMLKDKKLIPDSEITLAEMKKILRTPEILNTLPLSAQADLKFNPNEEIPREVIDIMCKELYSNLKGIKLEIAGSYRRQKPLSHDIDIVVSLGLHKRFEPLWDRIYKTFENNETLKFEEPYASGQGKVATFANITDDDGKKWVAKVDVFITPPKSYIYMLLYATGSGLFNIRMRAVAKKRGYLLNQKGLFTKKGHQILQVEGIENEKQIFELLDMTYKKPHERVA